MKDSPQILKYSSASITSKSVKRSLLAMILLSPIFLGFLGSSRVYAEDDPKPTESEEEKRETLLEAKPGSYQEKIEAEFSEEDQHDDHVIIGKFKVEIANPRYKDTKTISHYEEMLPTEEVERLAKMAKTAMYEFSPKVTSVAERMEKTEQEYFFLRCGKGITLQKHSLDPKHCIHLIENKKRSKLLQYEFKVAMIEGNPHRVLEITGGFERTIVLVQKRRLKPKARVFVRQNSWGENLASSPPLPLYEFHDALAEVVKEMLVGRAWFIVGSGAPPRNIVELSEDWELLQKRQSQMFAASQVLVTIPNLWTFGTMAQSALTIALLKQTTGSILRAGLFGGLFAVNTVGDLTAFVEESENWNRPTKYAWRTLTALYTASMIYEFGQFIPALMKKNWRVGSRFNRITKKGNGILKKVQSNEELMRKAPYIAELVDDWIKSPAQFGHAEKMHDVLTKSGTEKFRMLEKIRTLDEIHFGTINKWIEMQKALPSHLDVATRKKIGKAQLRMLEISNQAVIDKIAKLDGFTNDQIKKVHYRVLMSDKINSIHAEVLGQILKKADHVPENSLVGRILAALNNGAEEKILEEVKHASEALQMQSQVFSYKNKRLIDYFHEDYTSKIDWNDVNFKRMTRNYRRKVKSLLKLDLSQ